MQFSPRTHAASIEIAASPQTVYAAVSDVTRTGEWSPICKQCWWHEGDGPRVGARFTGRNVTAEDTWETVSTVTVADPGTEFAWEVGEGWVRWAYRLTGSGDRCTLTEAWEFPEAGLKLFVSLYGDDAAAHIDGVTQAAHEGIPATLSAIKRVVEAETA
ncbi:MAG: SRPBCC family protein [Nocardia sp.]|nr:SRPBCC family protein [Nocardia sp.]